jgi:cell wall-associated NlpC family hydrolase
MTTSQQETIVRLARSLIGKPYKWGATPEEAPDAFDCSSFVQHLFKKIGIELPRVSFFQCADANGIEVVPASDYTNLEPGDLIFTRGTVGRYNDEMFNGRPIAIGHVALYVGNGNIIHSRHRLGGVAEQTLGELTAEPNHAITLVKRF